jgi:CBS domain containing-hemolysin-like protein
VDYGFIILGLVTFSTIFSSGFLSFAEAAVMSLNKNKFQVYKNKNGNSKKWNVKALDKILKKKQNYITTIIILNTIVNICGSMIIGGMAVPLFSEYSGLILDFTLFSESSYSFTIDFAVSANAFFTIMFTFGILYFAEMIPKLIASQKSLEISLFVSIPLYIFEKLIKPLVWVSLKICSQFVKNAEEPKACLMEVKAIVKEANKDGIIDDRELDIINNTFSLSEKKVSDLMMCKTAIEYLNGKINILDNRKEIIELTHKRIIVTEGDCNETPIGVVVVEDLLKGILKNENKNVADYMHELLIVNNTDSLSNILADFNDTADHLALVKCHDGTYQGVLAVEDVLDGISIGFPD